MKVRMVQQMSGHRHDGSKWPGPGHEFEVGDEEGAYLVHNNIAVPVEERKAEERRPAAHDPAVETRAGAEDDAKAAKPPAKEEEQAKPRTRKA